MSDTPSDKPPLLGVDWLKTVAGALAAVSTTVLLSTLGAAGTLIGAALGSIAATVATALYSQGLARSRASVRKYATTKYVTPDDPARTTQATRVTPTVRTSAASATSATGPDGGSASRRRVDRLRGLPWKRLLPTALVMFLVVIAFVTAFELISGRTLASTVGGGDDGGTTISRVTDPGGGSGGTNHRTPSPTAEPSPTSTSTSSPTTSPTPTSEPSSSPSQEPTETASPSVGSGASQSPAPTIGGSPSVSATPEQQSGE
ncbi:hypothetical protein [Nocardioides sp. CER19]|uniref:hypothetical protein n=1 Tax=Nocardioides sp. CER19 TaxID=3038538 RepID=UPI002449A9F3|nr:hypothetical protein [Nocardioides sp. CER19]MDH2414790.1 hypothetical protein [Nocardioides sp. CER19]